MLSNDGPRGRGSLTMPKLVLSCIALVIFLLVEPLHGQPNYYFKASAPAVKSLPRIGRRSDDTPITDLPNGMVEMWQPENIPALDSYGGLRTTQSQYAPSASANNAMHRAFLWRKLIGEGGGNTFDDFVENVYHSKS